MNNTIQSVRTYDFDVLKKTLPKQDVSGVTKYQVPEELMPDVMNQKDCQCCMACAIAGILSAMSQAKTDNMEQYFVHLWETPNSGFHKPRHACGECAPVYAELRKYSV